MLSKLLILSLVVHYTLAAKILALMVVASHSHHFWNSKYLKALSDRGHEIVYFSVDKFLNPPQNITNIHMEGLYEHLYDDSVFIEMSDKNAYENLYWMLELEEAELSFHLRSPALKKLINLVKTQKFDLVVHDLTTCNYLLGAVDVLGTPPIVGITPFGVPTWAQQILGNPITYSSNPHFYTPYSNKMNILQRANNYFLHLFSFAVRWLSVRKHTEYSKECFGESVRPLNEIFENINIILVNHNPALDYSFPRVPGLIPVGGLHIEEPKPLSPELESFLNESKEGVVYFSLGSNIQSSTLEKGKVEILLKAFQLLSPVRVLWKWESTKFPNQPRNVRVEKWLPQNDILAHPNVRVFFTHCGLLSTQEAIYHGKPIVGMPFFLDQHINLAKSVRHGFGEPLKFSELTSQLIVQTIQKILVDPRYEERARHASKIFKDEIDKPLDRAVYWTEYVLRHQGAFHLRDSSRDLFWFQNSLIDVFFFIFLLICFSCFTFKVIFQFVFQKQPKLKTK